MPRAKTKKTLQSADEDITFLDNDNFELVSQGAEAEQSNGFLYSNSLDGKLETINKRLDIFEKQFKVINGKLREMDRKFLNEIQALREEIKGCQRNTERSVRGEVMQAVTECQRDVESLRTQVGTRNVVETRDVSDEVTGLRNDIDTLHRELTEQRSSLSELVVRIPELIANGENNDINQIPDQVQNLTNLYLHRDLKLPSFSGTESEVEVSAFLNELDNYITLTQTSAQQAFLVVAHTLKGNALRWFRSVQDRLHNYQGFRSAFIQEYLGQDRLLRLRIDMFTAKFNPSAGKTLTEHLNMLLQKNGVLDPPLDETTLVKLAVKQFPASVQKTLVGARVATTSELFALLKELESINQSQQSVTSYPRNRSNPVNTVGITGGRNEQRNNRTNFGRRGGDFSFRNERHNEHPRDSVVNRLNSNNMSERGQSNWGRSRFDYRETQPPSNENASYSHNREPNNRDSQNGNGATAGAAASRENSSRPGCQGTGAYPKVPSGSRVADNTASYAGTSTTGSRGNSRA